MRFSETIARPEAGAPADGDCLAASAREMLRRFLAARRMCPDQAENLLRNLEVMLRCPSFGRIVPSPADLCRMLDDLVIEQRRMAAPLPDEVEAALPGALAELPGPTLAIFRRFRCEGMTQDRIAVELGLSQCAVADHLQQAYGRLMGARLAG